MRRRIPKNINDNEVIIKALFDPISCSVNKNEVKENAFLPPNNRRDVSMMRKKYATMDKCKKQALKINMQNFVGFAAFKAVHVKEVAEECCVENNILIAPRPLLKFTPMDGNGNYYKIGRVAYRNSTGFPMHTDLLYQSPMVRGQINNALRKFAKKMAKISTFYVDPYPKRNIWLGKQMSFKFGAI